MNQSFHLEKTNRLCAMTVSFLCLCVAAHAPARSLQLHSGKTVSVQIEEASDAPLRISFVFTGGNEVLDIGPNAESYRFPTTARVISMASMKNPLVLALMSEAGGSDCTYGVKLFALEDGVIPQVFPSEEESFSNEGGLAIWASGRTTRMVVWKPHWAGKEGHYDKHFYYYDWYRWSGHRHRFLFVRSAQSRKRLDSGEKSLKLPVRATVEISARTRSDWFPEAARGC
jgi:hypothetical protein